MEEFGIIWELSGMERNLNPIPWAGTAPAIQGRSNPASENSRDWECRTSLGIWARALPRSQAGIPSRYPWKSPLFPFPPIPFLQIFPKFHPCVFLAPHSQVKIPRDPEGSWDGGGDGFEALFPFFPAVGNAFSFPDFIPPPDRKENPDREFLGILWEILEFSCGAG